MDILNKPLSDKNKLFAKNKPFPYLLNKDVFDEKFLKQVKKEMLSEDFFEKSNDLYTFLQTEDFKLTKKPALKKLLASFKSAEFRAMMTSLTGIELNDTVDMAGQIYPQGGHLLCHDDELEGRRIAFIIYLVDDWKENDGGHLDLYSCDNMMPDKIETSILPAWNSFAFFEVRPESYHQVREVLGKKDRISITGWFHGKPKYAPKDPPTLSQEFKTCDATIDLVQWIDKKYLHPTNMAQIRTHFEEHSSILLQSFLKKEALDNLLSTKCNWKAIGPADRRHYTQTKLSAEKFFLSSSFAAYLSDITGLPLGEASFEMRRFVPGDYTLVHDKDEVYDSLDVSLFLSDVKGDGGNTIFMSQDEELLTVVPQMNSLSLVHVDKTIRSFVKYVDKKTKGERLEVSGKYLLD